MKIIILQSALKHGIAEEDIFTVVSSPTHEIRNFEPNRRKGLPDPTLYIGKASGTHIEVFAYELEDCIIFHAMKLRGKIYMKALALLAERNSNE